MSGTSAQSGSQVKQEAAIPGMSRISDGELTRMLIHSEADSHPTSTMPNDKPKNVDAAKPHTRITIEYPGKLRKTISQRIAQSSIYPQAFSGLAMEDLTVQKIWEIRYGGNSNKE